MDNLTHSLAGLTVAEAALRFVPPHARSKARGYAWTLSAIANNFPDLDIVYAPFLSGRMSYLLHHRGHTHTLLVGLFESVFVFALGWVWAKRKKRNVSKIEIRLWWGLCFLGPILHIGLDYLNSYGVHPFWPIDNRWYYGDSLFILEPTFWVLLIPPLFFVSSNPIVRALFGAMFATSLIVSWATPFIPTTLAILLTGLAGGAWFAARHAWHRYVWVSSLLVLLIFFVVGRIARGQILRSVSSGVDFQDIILSPLPANPLCWAVITVEKYARKYRIRKGLVGPFPAIYPPERCPRARQLETTMPRLPVSLPEEAHVMWIGQWEEEWERIESMERTHCGFSAFVRFARAPFIVPLGSQWIIGDARYDVDADLGFAEFIVPPRANSCPTHVPPWEGKLFAH